MGVTDNHATTSHPRTSLAGNLARRFPGPEGARTPLVFQVFSILFHANASLIALQ